VYGAVGTDEFLFGMSEHGSEALSVEARVELRWMDSGGVKLWIFFYVKFWLLEDRNRIRIFIVLRQFVSIDSVSALA
jgi:hypothetical protein